MSGISVTRRKRPHLGGVMGLENWGCGASGVAGWIWTRRRGGTEEDAEVKQERRKERDSRVGRVAEPAENAEGRGPSFARMDKPEAYPT
jgi:hypothetical protein